MGLLSITKDNHANHQSTASPEHNFKRRSASGLLTKQRGCKTHLDWFFADIFSAEFCIAYAIGESVCAWFWVQHHRADSCQQ
jgi:hypothetical protein